MVKLGSVLGVLLLAATIIYVEWKNSEENKVRWITGGITAISAVIGILLLFDPSLPGPGAVVKLLFGGVDKALK
ncbi:hypothetical protein [Paenibacillus silvae]|uniref:Uncharacterized protein n=1 Tax=Paenibacillus silvae TaxID=1325358 RepID=A0A2W6NG13_9BACL|nr:hypothetical protein [Paenibacillus silvae]PZT54659.1 hypothetical protein DN757_16115 [Paenibacillus silvae]